MNYLRNINLLTKAQYDAQTTHSDDELWAIESKVIVEASESSAMPSWYRVYSDGWIEQGGVASAAGTIVFVKTFANTNFSVVTSNGASVSGKATTSFYISTGGNWYACGF